MTLPGLQKELIEVIERFDALTTPAEIFEGFGDLGRRLDLPWVSCGPLVSGPDAAPANETFFRYPGGWLDYYFGRDFLRHDPVVKAGRTLSHAFAWSDLKVEKALSKKTVGFRIMKEAANAGLPDGMTMPVHGPKGRVFLLSVAGEGDLKSPSVRRLLRIGALWAHERLSEALNKTDAWSGPALSVREQSCIMWASEGKTDEEIGQILSISAATVSWNILQVKKKLGVYSRIQAVAHVIRMKMID
ncbi:hypothetical protein D3874_02260 [Oleomonas cavernae]|uniref:HTH luxR-type domain-containing protein n=1 Tax=Oleomonas cavernae TaxID=2320859 RepID=A0A418WTT3_9PROT|nr:LuxR family transcriptional regulator [Oleomonas cavernae]RJF94670.1 hypothetical protein D3874_02260 [Oleomonas cavernae]